MSETIAFNQTEFGDRFSDTMNNKASGITSSGTLQSYVKEWLSESPSKTATGHCIAREIGNRKTAFEHAAYDDEDYKDRRKAFQNVVADLNRSVLKPEGMILKPLNRPKKADARYVEWKYEMQEYIQPEPDKSCSFRRAKGSDGNELPVKPLSLTVQERGDITTFELGSGHNVELGVSELLERYSLDDVAEEIVRRLDKRTEDQQEAPF